MPDKDATALGEHSHIFLGQNHAQHERGTWAAIALTCLMMVAEIAGGTLFGSLAVVADGFHMATHALALFLAAAAYTFARRHAGDPCFVFGTGKFGDLAGYTSAIILLMIALGIGYEAALRLAVPVTIKSKGALWIASAGLGVNIATAWLLGGSGSDHHRHSRKASLRGKAAERVHGRHGQHLPHRESAALRDHNFRAAFVHVAADAAISVLAICGLLLARFLGWVFMDPLMGLAGALVIANWAFGLIRDTSHVLLDMTPDEAIAGEVRRLVEDGGDHLADFHLWRLGPGHLGAILSVVTAKPRDAEFYHARLQGIHMISHLTIEVRSARAPFKTADNTWWPWLTGKRA